MRKFMIPAAAVAAFAFVAADATPAQAQVIVGNGGYSSYYGGGVLPVGQGGIIQAVEGQILNSVGLGGYNTGLGYNSYYGGYGNYLNSGYGNYLNSGYGNSWNSGYYNGYQPYYSGYTNYGGYGRGVRMGRYRR